MAPSAFDRAQVVLVCQRERTVEMAAWDNWSGLWHLTQPSLICWGRKNVSHGLKIGGKKKKRKNHCLLVQALMIIWKKRTDRCAETHVWPLESPWFLLWFYTFSEVDLLPYKYCISPYINVSLPIYFSLIVYGTDVDSVSSSMDFVSKRPKIYFSLTCPGLLASTVVQTFGVVSRYDSKMCLRPECENANVSSQLLRTFPGTFRASRPCKMFGWCPSELMWEYRSKTHSKRVSVLMTFLTCSGHKTGRISQDDKERPNT